MSGPWDTGGTIGASIAELTGAAAVAAMPGAVVAGSAATSTVLLAANASRRNFRIYNQGTAPLFVLLNTGSASATVNSAIVLAATDAYESDLYEYAGIISGFSSAAISAIVAEGV